jgi:hypothetical protein
MTAFDENWTQTMAGANTLPRRPTPKLRIPKDWADAQEILAGGRNPNTRKVANNTYVERRGEDFAVRLHNTDVVTFKADCRIVLDSGGWQTVTTKDRINASLNHDWALRSEKGVWRVERRGHGGYQTVALFKDGVTLYPDGRVEGGDPADAEAGVQRRKRKVLAYIKGYADAFVKGEVKAPTAGDCWYCSMRTEDGKTMGDHVGATESHLQAHVDEKYYVPSLLANAIEENPGSVSQFSRGYIGETWAGRQPETWGDIAQRDIKRALKKYLYKRFGWPI